MNKIEQVDAIRELRPSLGALLRAVADFSEKGGWSEGVDALLVQADEQAQRFGY